MSSTTDLDAYWSELAAKAAAVASAEAELATARADRDEAIRRGVADLGVTMYATAKRVGISQQAIHRIVRAGSKA